MALTEPSVVGGDCYCENGEGYKPFFTLVVHAQNFLLDKDSERWKDNRTFADDHISPYWYDGIPVWYKRHLVAKHERKHIKRGKENFDDWKDTLEKSENSTFQTKKSCLEYAEKILTSSWEHFVDMEFFDMSKVDAGEYRRIR